MRFGENVRRIRKELGMTQTELAVRCGLYDASTISKIERGLSDVTSSTISKLANALGVTPSVLLDEDAHPMVSPKPDKKLLQEIEETAVSDKKKLMDELLQLTEWFHLGLFTKEEFEAGKKFILEMMK